MCQTRFPKGAKNLKKNELSELVWMIQIAPDSFLIEKAALQKLLCIKNEIKNLEFLNLINPKSIEDPPVSLIFFQFF